MKIIWNWSIKHEGENWGSFKDCGSGSYETIEWEEGPLKDNEWLCKVAERQIQRFTEEEDVNLVATEFKANKSIIIIEVNFRP